MIVCFNEYGISDETKLTEVKRTAATVQHLLGDPAPLSTKILKSCIAVTLRILIPVAELSRINGGQLRK